MEVASLEQNTLDKAYYKSRREDILKLRLDDRMTYAEIAELYGVTRQRIHQLVGTQVNKVLCGVASRTIHDKDWLEEHKHLTNDEVIAITGLSYSTISRVRRWTWYQSSGAGHRTKRHGELFVERKLKEKGFENIELKPCNDYRDIVVHGENKDVVIDVKVCRKNLTPPSRYDSGSYAWAWMLHLHKEKRDVIDFYVLVVWRTRDCFIIPVNDIPENMAKIAFVFPNNWGRRTSWQKYHERWDLIEELLAH